MSVEPVTLRPEVLVPGDLQIGAAPFTQNNPHIVDGPNGITLAVWSDDRTLGGTQADIWAARIAADGSLIDTLPIAVNHDGWGQTKPKAAWNGSNWLISWQSAQNPSYSQVHAARLSPEGVVLDASPIVVQDNSYTDTYGNPTSPDGPLDVEPAGNDFVVTWARQEPVPGSQYNTAGNIYATKVTNAGALVNPAGTRIGIGPANQVHSWIALEYSPSNGGQFLTINDVNGVLQLTRRDLNLNSLGTLSRSNLRTSRYQNDLAGGPEGWIFASRADLAGSQVEVNSMLISPTLNLSSQTTLYTDQSEDPYVDAAWTGTDWIVTYTDSVNLGSWNIYGRRVSSTGVASAQKPIGIIGNPPLELSTIGNGAGKYSVLFGDSNGGTLDVAFLRVSETDAAAPVTDVSNAARTHTTPMIASDGTNFLSVFNSFNQDVSELKAVRLNNLGEAIDSEPFTIVPDSMNATTYEVVRFNGNYLVLFVGDGATERTIFGQYVSSEGQLVGSPVAIMPAVALRGFGLGDASVLGDKLLLAGNSNEGALERSWRFARIFDTNLQPVSERLFIGNGFVLAGDVATVGGRWLATWSWKSSHNAPRSGIAYRFISPDGTMADQVTLVSSYPDNGTPTVASAGPDSSEAMIFFQRYDLHPELGGPFWFPNSNEGVVGQRISANGTLIGGLQTIVDQPGKSGGARATFDGSNYVLSWVDTRNHQYPEQENADVYAARVAIDGTVLDPGGFAIASTLSPEDSAIAVSGGGRTFFAFRQFRYEKPWTSYRIATRLLDDVTAPQASSTPIFNYDDASAIQAVFGERLRASSSVASLDEAIVVVNTQTGQRLDPSRLRVIEESGAAGAWEYRWVYENADGTFALPPDGNYTATLPAGSVLDKAGNPLASAVTLSFHVLAGDANRDRVVDFSDLLILAQNYGQTGKTFSQGNFNYDATGDVNFEDLLLLAQRYGTSLVTTVPVAQSAPKRNSRTHEVLT